MTVERRETHGLLMIQICMKQHLTVFESQKLAFFNKCLSSCSSCLESNNSEFVVTPFVTLFTGNQAEPLNVVQVTEKGVPESKLPDLFGHVILPGERYFRGHYFELVRTRNISMKQLEIYPLLYICPLLKSTVPVLTQKAIYRWILMFTTLYSTKPEFRAISDICEAWKKHFERDRDRLVSIW